MSKGALDPHVVEQAIQWLVKVNFSTPDAATHTAFRRWLTTHPDHALAWQRVEGMSSEFNRLPPRLSQDTLGASRHRGLSRRDSLKLLGVLGVGASAAWVAAEQGAGARLMADRSSGLGERLAFQGPLGSRVLLNGDSAVDLLSGREPGVRLRRGEMIVDLDNRSPSPVALTIETRDGRLQTQGAHLLLHQRDNTTALSVLRGTVALGLHADASPVQIIEAGQRLAFTPRGRLPLADNGIDPWAWRDGVLSARHARLDDVVAELSRYRRGILRCSEDVAALRVSGSFQLANTDQVLSLLARTLPVQVRYRTRFWATLAHA